MIPKVRISIGTTLNLGNYNSARATIEIEQEVTNHMGVDPEELIKQTAETTYMLAEQELVDKIARLVNRLEIEGFLPDGG